MSDCCRGCIYFLSLQKSTKCLFPRGVQASAYRCMHLFCFLFVFYISSVFALPAAEDWDMLDVDEDEKLTGEEEFELLAGPLGLSERRIVPEAVQFPDSDPLGASVAMVTATNSMEETLLQIGEVEDL